MKKTITEWSSYIRITEKKIKRVRTELEKEMYIVTTKGEYTLKKHEFEERKKKILAHFQSLEKLKDNLSKVKMARQLFNATTKISVAGREITVATAVDLWRKKEEAEVEIEILYKTFSEMKNEENKKTLHYDREKNRIMDELNNKTRTSSNAEKEVAEERIEDNIPFVIDPLNIGELYNKKRDNLEEFMEEVNSKINIINAISELEIDIEE